MDNTVDIRADERLRRHCRYSAFLGAGIWLLAVGLLPRGETWAIAAIPLFVPLVLIRLGFAFLIPHGPVKRYRLWYLTSYSQLPTAVLLTIAFLQPAGTSAQLLAIPWLLFTLLLAGLAIDRIARSPRPRIEEFGQLAEVLSSQFQETAKYRDWTLCASAVMANHIHRVVQVPEGFEPKKCWVTSRRTAAGL